ncbi:MAG: hypothetical protein K0S86_103 [Geminicoccaceae bacterium]|jgi:hypothetical protein|nr:hypothetical protein [Geminicoccaceae bacterium]
MVRDLLPRVAAVRYVRGHVLWLKFSDGVEGEVDLTDGLEGELFAPIRDPEMFARATVEDGAVTWPNGADWAPETLYERVLVSKGFAERTIDGAWQGRSKYIARMPEISRFFGIGIRMLANEHAPPNFHAVYGEYEVTVTIDEGVVTGRFPGRPLRLVLEWRDLHQAELAANWQRLRAGHAPHPIPPLS